VIMQSELSRIELGSSWTAKHAQPSAVQETAPLPFNHIKFRNEALSDTRSARAE
jgi:hypothetical protein